MQISPEVDARAGRHDLRAAEGDRLRVGVRRGRSRIACATCRASSTTGRRRTSRRCCTRSAAGYANNMASLRGPRREGARRSASRSSTASTVTALALGQRRGGGDRGRDVGGRRLRCDEVVVAVGPWINSIWNMLDLPKTITIKGRDGKLNHGIPMWHYMALQEGTLGVDPDYQKTNDGADAAGASTSTPTRRSTPTATAALITDKLWGLYYKPDFHFGGVQGGAMPAVVERPADEVRVDPYGPKSPEFVVDRQLRRHVDLRARVLPEALRRPARDVPARSRRAASAASRPTASRCSTAFATTST